MNFQVTSNYKIRDFYQNIWKERETNDHLLYFWMDDPDRPYELEKNQRRVFVDRDIYVVSDILPCLVRMELFQPGHCDSNANRISRVDTFNSLLNYPVYFPTLSQMTKVNLTAVWVLKQLRFGSSQKIPKEIIRMIIERVKWDKDPLIYCKFSRVLRTVQRANWLMPMMDDKTLEQYLSEAKVGSRVVNFQGGSLGRYRMSHKTAKGVENVFIELQKNGFWSVKGQEFFTLKDVIEKTSCEAVKKLSSQRFS